MNTIAWVLVAVYAVGLVLGLVAACSARRYRELRTQKMYEKRWFATSDHEKRQDRNNLTEQFVGEIVFSFIWPLTIIVWFLGQILVFLIDIMSIPGERKAERDGLIDKDKE